ncbi:hypothetical protein [Sphingobacterium sp. SYP-B4668]|uniref:hypothetical protein n=1 Tax=Sphingobacterium sp. SYP-B4668 TaxID=2996035 RepID=UPI0022DCEC73|nr:hypothetical protein [Sphingobacterium sp. SYP-B4668]
MNILRKIRQGLRDAAQIIIIAPVKLPVKVVAVARYVALVIGLLEALDSEKEADGVKREDKGQAEEGRDETQ